MQTQLESKHHEKRNVRKETRCTGIKLKSTLGLILFSALLYQLNIAISSEQLLKVIYRHQKKILTFRVKQKQRASDVNHIRDRHLKSIVQNHPSSVLSKDEKIALSFSIKNHIPTKTFCIAINTEFEQFFQRLLHDISHISEED